MWNNWITRWQGTVEAIERLGGKSTGLHIGKPASEQQLQQVEHELGHKIPESFRDVLLHFAGRVEFGWQLDDCIELPKALKGIFAGQCVWNIDDLIGMEESRKDWIRECFPNPDDEYDRVWHNKLAFMRVDNGDLIALDMEECPEHSPVVYLSHDDGEGHGCVLGQDFMDFIDKWTLIGCPGLEDWQMIPFVDTQTNGINPESKNALEWRRLIGLKL